MRKVFYIVMAFVALCVGMVTIGAATSADAPHEPTFEDAIRIIKKYEGMHSARHWPFVGYGHKVLPSDKIKKGTVLTEAQADRLLREDMRKLCARYRSFGPDSLLLAALAYNTGIGTVAKSSVYSKLKAGIREIRDAYVAHCRYRGRENPQIKRRRIEEYESLFVKELPKSAAQTAGESVVSGLHKLVNPALDSGEGDGHEDGEE